MCTQGSAWHLRLVSLACGRVGGPAVHAFAKFRLLLAGLWRWVWSEKAWVKVTGVKSITSENQARGFESLEVV